MCSVPYAQKEAVFAKMNRNKTEHADEFSLMHYTVNEFGDTILISGLKPVEILSLRNFAKPKEQKKYDKLVSNIKKVYPYAHEAGILMAEKEKETLGMSKKDRKEYMKKVEDELEAKYGTEIKRLSKEQGRILLKLIDRQTGESSYDLVAGFRGEFRAWFYNGMAKLFGYDLKSKFDPQNNLEDKYIDEVVRMIEAGAI
jgi:hypothetical protein